VGADVLAALFVGVDQEAGAAESGADHHGVAHGFAPDGAAEDGFIVHAHDEAVSLPSNIHTLLMGKDRGHREKEEESAKVSASERTADVWKKLHKRLSKTETSNIQHPTPNIQCASALHSVV
jgi:hypothetical protein